MFKGDVGLVVGGLMNAFDMVRLRVVLDGRVRLGLRKEEILRK
jgi:hypothetical protein